MDEEKSSSQLPNWLEIRLNEICPTSEERNEFIRWIQSGQNGKSIEEREKLAQEQHEEYVFRKWLLTRVKRADLSTSQKQELLGWLANRASISTKRSANKQSDISLKDLKDTVSWLGKRMSSALLTNRERKEMKGWFLKHASSNLASKSSELAELEAELDKVWSPRNH